MTAGQLHLIDVREDHEYAQVNIPGSKHMPLSNFAAYVDEIRGLEGKKIIYCRSGNRSGQAISFLRPLGVSNMENGGGISDVQNWLASK